MAKGTCSIIEDGERCGAPVKARGWCLRHYQRYRAHGDPLAKVNRRISGTPEVRFWVRVNKDGPVPDYAPHLGPCWIWTGDTDKKGYGRFGISHGKHVRAHRFSYMLEFGPIPGNLDLDHLCRVHACVRPVHLEPVTDWENTLRSPTAATAVNARKTHCKRGHLFDEANTYRPPSGGRQCRACKRLSEQGLLRNAAALW